jgi:hypothetical protein
MSRAKAQPPGPAASGQGSWHGKHGRPPNSRRQAPRQNSPPWPAQMALRRPHARTWQAGPAPSSIWQALHQQHRLAQSFRDTVSAGGGHAAAWAPATAARRARRRRSSRPGTRACADLARRSLRTHELLGLIVRLKCAQLTWLRHAWACRLTQCAGSVARVGRSARGACVCTLQQVGAHPIITHPSLT